MVTTIGFSQLSCIQRVFTWLDDMSLKTTSHFQGLHSSSHGTIRDSAMVYEIEICSTFYKDLR